MSIVQCESEKDEKWTHFLSKKNPSNLSYFDSFVSDKTPVLEPSQFPLVEMGCTTSALIYWFILVNTADLTSGWMERFSAQLLVMIAAVNGALLCVHWKLFATHARKKSTTVTVLTIYIHGLWFLTESVVHVCRRMCFPRVMKFILSLVYSIGTDTTTYITNPIYHQKALSGFKLWNLEKKMAR